MDSSIRLWIPIFIFFRQADYGYKYIERVTVFEG